MSVDSADVVVIGGGVSGLSSGYYLAKAGRDVVVVEKGTVGLESSARNGGLISAAVDQGAVAPTVVESLKMWPTLHEELGYPTEFIGEGRLRVAFTEEHMQDIYQAEVDYREGGLGAKVMDSREARDMVPGLSERALGGLFTPDAGHANPQQTVEAFARGFQDRGGRLYQRTAVTGINVKDGRVSSVETDAGPIATEFVVSAAGPQTAQLAEMVGVYVPSVPAKLECIVTVPLEPLFEIVLTGNGLYGRQTKRGNLQFGGGPVEFTEVDVTGEPPKPSSVIIRNIARRLAELLPGVEDQRLLRAWAGIVEVTPDAEPIIEMLDSPKGYVLVDQSSHGFAPAPATGVVVRDLIIEGKSPFDISALSLGRFEKFDGSWRRAWGWELGAYTN